MRVSVVGTGALSMKLRRAAEGTGPTMAAILYREGNTIMSASKAMYVPVDKGPLRASGFVDEPLVQGQQVTVTLGFGGPSAPYALIVHEDLTKRHPVGQAKYLEIPFRARVQGMKAVLKQRLNDMIRQAFQRLGKVEANVKAGRDVNWGMPLYHG